MATNNEAFVYCWTDHKTNMLYVGSHRGTESDGYICSSKPMLAEYTQRPHDFTRQIIATGNTEDIRELEHRILLSSNAANDLEFYNIGHGGGRFYRKGVKMTEEHKKKISEANKNKPKSEAHKSALRKARRNIPPERLKELSKIARASVKNISKGEKHSEIMKISWIKRRIKYGN